MIVYRVEHAGDFTGPYRNYDDWDRFNGDAPGHRPTWEAPTDQPLGAPWSGMYRFAFASEEKCWRWFDDPSELSKLHDKGFVLSVYHADDSAVVASRCRAQIVFKPQAALLIERRNLTEAA